MQNAARIFAACLVAATLGCVPRVQEIGPAMDEPRLAEEALITADGARLPLRVWLPNPAPRAVVLAVHGFNDYSNAFAEPAAYLCRRGIAVYAYDQRGFGATDQAGLWPGVGVMVGDLGQMVAAVRARHPGLPLYLLGESMGGAVAMVGLARHKLGSVDGAILVAPAVWGRRTMNLLYRTALWLSAYSLPWLKVSGRGLGFTPSDNREMLLALGRDPLVIKDTRIDSIYGLVNLMDAALDSAPALTTPLLVLYGARDEIIPKGPTAAMLAALDGPHRVAVYPDGYHMLLRDLDAKVPLADIAAWIADPAAPLPSGFDRDWRRRFGP